MYPIIINKKYYSIDLIKAPRRQKITTEKGKSFAKPISKMHSIAESWVSIFSSMTEGVMVLDEKNCIQTINDACIHVFDLHHRKKNGLIGTEFEKLAPLYYKNGKRVPVRNLPSLRAKKNKKTSKNTLYFQGVQTNKILEITADPILIKDEPVGSVLHIRDVTGEMQREWAVHEFLSLASHQLRTPISIVAMNIGALQHSDLWEKAEPDDKMLISDIEESAHRMSSLIDSLMHVARIEMNAFKVSTEKIDLVRFINKEIDQIKKIFRIKKVKIKKPRIKKSILIKTDPQLLKIILQNILTNAVYYSKKNGCVSVRIIEHSSGEKIRISVSDDGIGIPKKQAHRIFEQFYRAPNSIKKNKRGSGLGLYISKSLTEILNGKIWFNSEYGEGTTFYIEIPTKLTKSSKEKRRVM